VNVHEELMKGPRERIGALTDLGQLGLRGGELAITAVCGCLEDGDIDVRRAAVKALAKIAKRGDQNVITAVCNRLKHEMVWVRKSAFCALDEVAEKDDQNVIIAVRDHLVNDEHPYKGRALNTLVELADRGYHVQNVIPALCNCLEDDAVEYAALKSLAMIAARRFVQ
jgi:HEAT repeat protein